MRTCVYLPCRNIHVYVSLDSYICSGMHRLERRQWNCCQLALHPISSPWTFFFFFAFPAFYSLHLQTPPAWSTPPPPPVRPPSITSEETDANLILSPVRVSGTHRRLAADSEGPSATTVLISCDIRVSLQSLWSRQGVGWDELMADWPIYTLVTWSLTPPQARNIKLTAAYFEMCDGPGGCRYSGLSALYF